MNSEIITTRKKSGLIANILKVVSSNMLIIISGMFTSLLIPKIMTISDYGVFKTFTLYVSYVGICSLGIIDGVYLKYGGYDYSSLDRLKIRLYSKIVLYSQSILMLIVLAITIFYINTATGFVLFMLALNMFANNVTSYYQHVSQATKRFNELSLRNITKAILTIVSVSFLVLSYYLDWFLTDYILYITIVVLLNYVLMIWYIITYRDITFGKHVRLSEEKDNVLKLIITGFPLLFSNLCSTIILSLDRQFVNILYDSITYAYYAFAYNMLTIITTTVIAISSVIYPYFKRTDEDELKKNYPKLFSLILIFSIFCLNGYFVLDYFIRWFLPHYTASLSTFKLILPSMIFTSLITILIHNYYKTLGKSNRFFANSLFILVLSAIFNFFAYIIFDNVNAISIFSVISLAIWLLMVDIQLFKKINLKNYLYLAIMVTLYYVCVFAENLMIGFVFYLCSCIVFTLCFYISYLKKRRN